MPYPTGAVDSADVAMVTFEKTTGGAQRMDQEVAEKSDPVPPKPEERPFGGFSWLGVPYNAIDLRFASENLYRVYSQDGKNDSEIMKYVLEQNERVVSRCGMLVSFSGTLIALFLFVANRPKMLPYVWQQWAFYTVVAAWSLSTMVLLWSLKHIFPPTWEFHKKNDFMLTSELFLRRMGLYNITLLITILSFLSLLIVLSPISATISDKLFH
jgi:hypothetical protein